MRAKAGFTEAACYGERKMSSQPNPEPAGQSLVLRVVERLFGRLRLRFLPVLLTYFCYGASAITGVALVFFEKNALELTPAEVAEIGFWLGLPWSMKMVAGTASDHYPILGSRRKAYLLLGACCALLGYGWLATVVSVKEHFLLAMLLVTVGFMIQDVVADALSVEVAENEEELKQIQALGRVALLLGSISVGYLGGWLAEQIGARNVFAIAMVLPLLVAASVYLLPPEGRFRQLSIDDAPGAGWRPAVIMVSGLAYASAGVALQLFEIAYAQEIVLIVSGVLIAFLLKVVGISRSVVIAALVIFIFRSIPGVGQGYQYWAIDRLGFDERFLGLLSQVSSVLSLVGLLVFRKIIVERPVSFTLFWVVLAGSVLYLPSIGLFYGANEWLGITPRMFAFIDTTISAPLGQLTMVPILVLIAKSAKPGTEATTFAIMASLMNLALSTSELFTRYLNDFFSVSQQDYSNLGRLMIGVGIIGLLPLCALPLLRREERAGEPTN
jgi:MFS family permease